MALVAAAFCLLAVQRAEAGAYTNAYIYYDEGCDCIWGNAQMYADYYYNDGYYPYSVSEINQNQWLRYRCPYINQGQWVNMTGQINILMAVYPKDCCGNGPWYYTVQKSGYESKIDLTP